MKRTLMFLFCLLTASPAVARQETLFAGEAENGLFIAPVLNVSEISGEVVYFTGFRGAWIINHTFAFGYGSYGMGYGVDAPIEARQFYQRDGAPRNMLELDFRYRGIELEYIHDWASLFHWGVYAFAGSGTVTLEDPEEPGFRRSDTVYTLSPAFYGMLNLTRRFVAVAGASYRFVSNVELEGVSASELSGPAVNLELRFGWF